MLTALYEHLAQVRAHRFGTQPWPACGDVALALLHAVEQFDLEHDVLDEEPLLVEGYFDGVEDFYHNWVELVIDGRRWIVDGARAQFQTVTGDARPFAVFLADSDAGAAYLTEVED